MKTFVGLIAALVIAPTLALADASDIHGVWDMTAMDGDALDGIESRFRYTFRADGVLVTETPFANYDGTWEDVGGGRISFDLMSTMPGMATNECAYAVEGDALELSDCANGSPPASFIRAH